MPVLFGREHQLALCDNDLEPILLLPLLFGNSANLDVRLLIAILHNFTVHSFS